MKAKKATKDTDDSTDQSKKAQKKSKTELPVQVVEPVPVVLVQAPALAPAPVPAPVPAPAPTPVSKPVKAKVSKAKVVKDTVVEVKETDEVVNVEDVNSDNIVSDVTEKVSVLLSNIKSLQSSVKNFIKEYEKNKKIIDKIQKKKDNAKKSPSGFAKPCKISDELCEFIGVPKGTEQSRTDVTRFINAYVKEHDLNNPLNRREFFPDAKLETILNVKDNIKEGEKVTYFVLQRLISHHFPLSISKMASEKAKLLA